MVDRNETNSAQRSSPILDPNPNNQRHYTSVSMSFKARSVSDDLIVSLADAYENQRARQVSEWERMRQHVARNAT